MADEIKIDPRISIETVPDGEVHIVIKWTRADLELLARAYLSAETQGIPAEARLRIHNKAAVDYLISRLLAARSELYGSGDWPDWWPGGGQDGN
jgi:hypothetical protein